MFKFKNSANVIYFLKINKNKKPNILRHPALSTLGALCPIWCACLVLNMSRCRPHIFSLHKVGLLYTSEF